MTDGVVCRLARPSDHDQLVDLMVRTRSHFVGARHPALFSAIASDGEPPSRLITTMVAELDGVLVAFISAITSDKRRYWATLPLRHPRAALAIAAHRARKFRSRLDYRRKFRADYATPEVPPPEADLPPEVEARLNQRPPTSGSPRPGERGAHISQGLFMGVDKAARGRRVGVTLFASLFAELRARGVQRYDASFSSEDPAAIRMHCNFPFTIYRMPGGYWASLELADLDRPSGTSATS